MKNDTIAAISTGMTNSGIGIVRISGDEAFDIAAIVSFFIYSPFCAVYFLHT